MTSQKKFQSLVDKWGGQLKAKMREDPLFFINEIAGVGVGNYKLIPHQEHWVRLIHENDMVNLTAFRSSGKTEALGVCYPIYRAFTMPNWWGIVVSDKEEQSKEILQRIKNKIEQNPILSTSIPKNKSISWSKTEINLTNGSRILAKPYTDRLRSWHVDWVMFDEAGEYRDHDVYESNAYSITQDRSQSNPEGFGICVTGTPKSELDLLHKLRTNKLFKSLICPADMKLSELIGGSDNRTLWEIRYPKMTLKDKKKQVNNNIKFTREFLCKVLSAGDELFPYGVIEVSFDYEYGFEDKAVEGYSYYGGLDFALSGTAASDFSGYSIFKVCNKTGITRLVRLERYKGLSYPAQKLRIKQLHEAFKLKKFIADEGTFGKAFVQEMKQEGVPIHGFRFQHKREELLEILRNGFDINFTEEVDKNGQHIPLKFEERKFFINYNEKDTMCKKMIDLLVEELLGFGVIFRTSRTGDLTGTTRFESVKKHDDLVMAVALGYWGCRKRKAPDFAVARSSHSNKNLVFAKT